MKMTASRSGFTLVEIMLALLVVSVGVVTMSGLLGTALDTSSTAHDDLHAVSFADMVFNYYHAADWGDVPPGGSQTIPDYSGGTVDLSTGQFTANAGRADAYTLTFQFDATTDRSLKRLTLQIWSGLGTHGTPRIFQTELYDWEKNP